ncbi:MAG: hypothetical protein QOI38_456, partial [Sphingomonadales bacterium]|nr:hypothetical protein [Sphingomonadales bacterium]
MTQKTDQAAAPGGGINRALIDNVEVSLEAWLGEAKLTVADLGALKTGSV